MAAPAAEIPVMTAALRRQRAQLDDYDSATVGYWRLRQPQFTDSDIEATASDSDDDDAINEFSDSDYDSDAYELLTPSDATTDKILAASAFYDTFMPPRGDVATDALLAVCSSFPVRLTQTVCAALVRRFTTDVRFNWATKTLQSFLEVAVWLSVTLAALSLYRDALFALQVGVFAGALTSICDDVVLLFVHSMARVIRNQRGGRELLEQLGFDVPASGGKAPTDGHELALLKTSVFGYLGVVCLRALWTHLLDVPTFALLAAAAGASFVVTAEFCCLWLPTRRVGLTLQSRFTHIGRNWQLHPLRSAFEVVSWASATLVLYATTADMLRSLQLGTLVAVAVCLAFGLDELPEVDHCDNEEEVATSDYCVGFWAEHVDGDVLLRLAGAIVAAQAAMTQRLQWRS